MAKTCWSVFDGRSHIRTHAAAAPALRNICMKDLKGRLVLKYKDLQKTLRTAKKLPKRGEAVKVAEEGQEIKAEEEPGMEG